LVYWLGYGVGDRQGEVDGCVIVDVAMSKFGVVYYNDVIHRETL
jgi:hypothetical protein